MASTSVVVVKVVAVVVVLVTDVVVSSGMSATFTQGVAAIGFQIDAKSKRPDWWPLWLVAPSSLHQFEILSEFSIQSNPSSIKPFPSPSKITLKSFQKTHWRHSAPSWVISNRNDGKNNDMYAENWPDLPSGASLPKSLPVMSPDASRTRVTSEPSSLNRIET